MFRLKPMLISSLMLIGGSELAGRTLLPRPLDAFGAGILLEGVFVPDSKTGWALPPSRQFQFAGKPIITNSLGLRGSEPVSEDHSRVLAVGDSTVFGHGVAGKHAFPSIIESQLSQSQRVQVQNECPRPTDCTCVPI